MESGSPSPRADAFPAGLRVLVVDDDPTWLKILEKMLKKCSYEVTTCGLARVALDMLREKRDRFDIVVSDVNMPDMDGFNLLEQVGLEMDLPVIMMSVDGETSRVMRGVQHGACDYLLKPVRMKELRNIWQHVFRRRMHEGKDLEFRDGNEDSQIMRKMLNEFDNSCISSGNDSSCTRKRKIMENEEHDEQEFSDTAGGKKTRVVWSVDLHKKFVDAVNQIGFDKVGPKKILDLMNVPGLTRENVASHLQKYRLYLSRLQKQNESNASLCGAKQSENNFGDSLPILMQQNSPKSSLAPATSFVYPGKKNLVPMGGPHETHESESSSMITLLPLAQERKVILEENSEKTPKLNSSPCAEFGLVKVPPHMPLPLTWCSEISITQESTCLEKECSSFGMPNIFHLHFDHQPIKKTSDMGIYITGRDQLCLSQDKAMYTECKTMNQSTTSSLSSEVGSSGWDSTSSNQWLPNNKTIIISGMDSKDLSKGPENTMFPLLASMENFQHILDKEFDCSEVLGTNIDLLDCYDPISLAGLTSQSFDVLRFGYDCIWDATEYSTTDEGLFIT